MKKLLILFSALLLVTTISQAQKRTPKWLDTANIYHIYPSSFFDTNADGMGDLNGICAKLDYIRSVGFNTIWLSPCFCSDFKDGGYDITDFYKIDPRFGTNEDMQNLISSAHAKGIKVLLDLVAGHTSNKHPWFLESANAETNKYTDYFIWTKDKPAKKPGKKFVDNNYPRGGYYLKNFFDIQPALNYGYLNPNPNHPWEQGYDEPGPKAVREELKNIIAFWCDMGVDGFRVDMANSLIKGDNKTHDGTCKLWNEIFAWYRTKYPQNIMMSEWGIPSEALRAGFDIDLLIHSAYKICGQIYRPLVCETDDDMSPTICYFNKKGNGELEKPMSLYKTVVKSMAEYGGYASMPTCSHDIWRLTRMNRHTPEEQKVVLTWFLTLPTPPIVYYGEEIGMLNLEYAYAKEGSVDRMKNRATNRTPMQWDSSANLGFSTTDNPHKLYLPVDNSPEAPNVAAQQYEGNSILNYVRNLLALRGSTPALGVDGEWEYIGDLKNPYPMIYRRSYGKQNYIVVLNPADRVVSGSVKIIGKKATLVFSNNDKNTKCKTTANEHIFTLQPITSAIYKIE